MLYGEASHSNNNFVCHTNDTALHYNGHEVMLYTIKSCIEWRLTFLVMKIPSAVLVHLSTWNTSANGSTLFMSTILHEKTH